MTSPNLRRNWRFRLNHAEKASVDFDLPDGSHWSLNLVELSAEGFAFELENGRPELTAATRIDAVAIRVKGVQFAGTLRIVHVTKESEADTVCGAEFAPATDADAGTLALLITALEERDRRTTART